MVLIRSLTSIMEMNMHTATANAGNQKPSTSANQQPFKFKVAELKITPLARRSDDAYMRGLRHRRA